MKGKTKHTITDTLDYLTEVSNLLSTNISDYDIIADTDIVTVQKYIYKKYVSVLHELETYNQSMKE